MLRWRWLAVVGVSVLMSACAEMFPPCASPGAVTVRAPGDTINVSPGGMKDMNCLYRLNIKEVDKDSAEIKATVAKSVVEENRNRINDYLSRQLFSTTWFTDYSLDDYPFHVYAFRLKDKGMINQLKVGNDFDFENVPNTHYLELCGDTCKNNRKKVCIAHYNPNPPRPEEDKRCSENESNKNK